MQTIGVCECRVPRKVERELSVLEQASISMNSKRMPASTKSAVINAQMSEGMIEVCADEHALTGRDLPLFQSPLLQNTTESAML